MQIVDVVGVAEEAFGDTISVAEVISMRRVPSVQG